jgi:hypothetical protein
MAKTRRKPREISSESPGENAVPVVTAEQEKEMGNEVKNDEMYLTGNTVGNLTPLAERVCLSS